MLLSVFYLRSTLKEREGNVRYSKTLNNRTRGANNEYRGGPGGPGTGFCSPGGGFLALVAVVACHYVYYH